MYFCTCTAIIAGYLRMFCTKMIHMFMYMATYKYTTCNAVGTSSYSTCISQLHSDTEKNHKLDNLDLEKNVHSS